MVVIGGGFAGATAAKYLRLWSPRTLVTLVELSDTYVSGPLSNLVLSGARKVADLSTTYFALQSKYRVDVVRDQAVALDFSRRLVRIARGPTIPYDRLVVSPGADLLYESVPGMASQNSIFHAWKPGAQTAALRKQLEEMRPGGVCALHIPRIPFVCPSAAYERVCQIAWYFKKVNTRAKIIAFDANGDIVANKAIFSRAWKEVYGSLVEYRPGSRLVSVDAASRSIRTADGSMRADVLNVIPPQRAGAIAHSMGLCNVEEAWCQVDPLTFESTAARRVHVIGDAVFGPADLPKSGHTANAQAKLCAAAVIALLEGRPVNGAPVLSTASYSFVTSDEAIHSTSVHRYDANRRAMVVAEGSAGVSESPSKREGEYALAWARNLWADMMA